MGRNFRRLLRLKPAKAGKSESDNPDTVLVGDWSKGSLLPVYYSGSGHCLTIGATGAAKGSAATIPNALRAHYQFIYDPGGEVSAVSVKAWRLKGYAVNCLNPWGMHSGDPWLLPAMGFNPLDLLDPSSPNFSSDARYIASLIITRIGGVDKNQFFTDKAESGLQLLLMHCKTAEPPERQNLLTIREYLTSGADQWDALMTAMQGNQADDSIGRQANVWQREEANAPEMYQGVHSTMLAFTDWLEDAAIRKTVCTSECRCDDLKGFDANGNPLKGAVFAVIIPLQYAHTHAALVRLAIGCNVLTMLRGDLARERVLFQIDECASLGRMEIIASGLATLRRYRVWLWPIFQTASQIHHLYGDNWHTFEANCEMRQYLACRDLQTTEHVSKVLGNITYEYESSSTNEGTSTNEGKSEDGRTNTSVSSSTSVSSGLQRVARPLLMPDEIRQLRTDQQIVVMGNSPPLMLKIRPYWQRPELRGLFHHNPYYGSTPPLPRLWRLMVCWGWFLWLLTPALIAFGCGVGLGLLTLTISLFQ